MSLDVPTAFWKTDAAPAVVEDLSIDWTTSLAASYAADNTVPGYDYYNRNQPTDKDNYPIDPSGLAQTFPWTIGDTNRVPFITIDVNGYDDYFYNQYYDINWQGDTVNEEGGYYCTSFFGWNQGVEGTFDGTYINFADFHESNPWKTKVKTNGVHEIQLFFEADMATAIQTGTGGEADGEGEPLITKQDWDVSHPTGPEAFQVFNKFIQSGDATGTFSISAAQAGKDLQIKVSGLAEDALTDIAGSPYYMDKAPSYDAMTLYVKHPNDSSTFVCSGESPADERNVRSLKVSENYDQQQVKLYAGSDLSTIVNAQSVYANANKGQPRGTTSEDIDQNKRDWPGRYVTSNGVGTFTVANLTAGTHEIEIKASTIDGVYNSGAFYGFEFRLVD